MASTTLPSFGQALTSVGGNAGGASAVGPTVPQPTVNGETVEVGSAPFMPTAPYAMDIDSEFQDATKILGFALDRADAADGFLSQLGNLAASLAPPTVNPVFPNVGTLPAIQAPVAPAVAPISYRAPDLPAAFADTLTVSTAFPSFTAEAPSLTFPNAPSAPVLSLPDAPAVDLNFSYPTVDVDLPDAPPLLSISVQPFKGVDFPTLTATAPVLTAIPPSVTTYIPAAPYTDALLNTLTLTLKQRLDLGRTGTNTGLPPGVELAIWNRGREREYRAQAAALRDLDRMEGMGYSLPPGVYIDSRIKLQTETHYTLSTQSRDIAIEQAKLEQENIKTALEQAQAIESKLLDYANETEQRRFDATKYATEAGISIYNGQVQAYTAIVQCYRAAVDVYQAQIQGARAQVDIYTAEIQAEKLKVDANATLIQSYKVRVDAALASIQVFEGEISLIKTQAEVEQLKVSIFGEEVRSYAAQAQLFSTQVEAYKAGIEAENAKEAVFATSAQAYSTLVAATSKQIDSQLDVFKTKLSAKNLEVEVYKAQVSSEAERVRALAAQDSAVAAVYTATASATSSYNATLVEEYKTAQTIALQVTQVATSAAEANGKLYLSAASIATDAAKVGAQVEAQLGASALGANTYATHKSRQDSLSFGQSTSYGQSKSQSHSTSTSEGASTSVSYSTSTSVSASTSATESYSNNTNIAEAQ